MSIAMTTLHRRSPNRWSVTIGMVALVLAISALPILVWGADERSLRVIVRVTARCSGMLLFTVFAMPALSRLQRVGGWLDRNSPAIFLAFTASHLIHLGALIAWASFFPGSFFADFQLVPVLLGAGLYVFIALIAIKAVAGLSAGQLRLNRVETVGMYLLVGCVRAVVRCPGARERPACGADARRFISARESPCAECGRSRQQSECWLILPRSGSR